MNENKNNYLKNKFELEGNVSNVQNVYVNKNKKILRFDLAQKSGENTQFIPIVLKGDLVNSYGEEIQKGDWISVKGIISTYSKNVERDGKTYKDKAIDILAFEIIDKKNNKLYLSNGQIEKMFNNVEMRQER